MNPFMAPVIFGEVLFDCFPDGSRVLGGAPFNVAWHCQAFGLSPVLVSRVGDDELGDEILAAMDEWGLDVSGVQTDVEHATGIVDVQINDGQPSYDIVENSAWDFIDAQKVADMDAGGLLYHGSLALRNPVSAAALQKVKQARPSLFIDINLRPPFWESRPVRELVRGAERLKLNEDELLQIAPDGLSQRQAVDYFIEELAVELLIVTRGEQGVMAAVGQDILQVDLLQNNNPVVDTVGAGDAFSSVMLLGQCLGWPLLDSLQRAQRFASAIVGIRGATINSKAFYQPFLEEWRL
jgi:fructokinase